MKNIINTRTLFGAGLTALAFSSILTSTAFAQTCAVVPTCSELGYDQTASDCSGKKALKCPFDKSKLFCGETSGNNGGCTSPSVGDILYSDMSCNANVVSGKIAIGIVFEPDKRLAIALETAEKVWAEESFDVPDVTSYTTADSAKSDWMGKINTKTIVSYCAANSKSCPAFDYVSSYKTAGTNAGDWYLPALGELNAIYTNKSALNTALSKVGKTLLPGWDYWSSSEAQGYNYAWIQSFRDAFIYDDAKDFTQPCIPVLAF